MFQVPVYALFLVEVGTFIGRLMAFFCVVDNIKFEELLMVFFEGLV